MVIYSIDVSILLEEVIIHYLSRLIKDMYKQPYNVVIHSNDIYTYTPQHTNRPREGLI